MGFNFKPQCFYCTEECVFDKKHPDRNKFENVRTKDSALFTSTLEICCQRNDKYSKSTPGRPTSEGKMISFLAMCLKLENEMDLYTLTEFHEAMKKLGKEVYSVKVTKNKLFEKYGSSIRFVNRRNRSDIILENLRYVKLYNTYIINTIVASLCRAESSPPPNKL